MIKRMKEHFFQYFILLVILVSGATGFILSVGNKRQQFEIVVVTSCLYVIWGATHHFLEKTLYPKVVVEYITVALLGVVILKGLLL